MIRGIQSKEERGITLIALVVTIIVLIVLAGIAISMTVGDNGIFAKAKEAKRLQITAEAKEKIGTEILDAQVEAIERNEELEQAQVEDIISKYGTLQDDKDTIILKDNGYDIRLSDIYQGTITTSGSYTENKAKIELLEGQIKNLQEQLDKMTEENTKNKTEAENLRTEIESLKADVERQKELLDSMSQSGDEKDKKIAELNGKITTLENEKNELSNKNNELKNQNADLITKATELTNLKTTLGKVTASESQILKNYTVYKDGKLITGTIPINSTISTSVSVNGTCNIPAGYYSEVGQVKGPTVQKIVVGGSSYSKTKHQFNIGESYADYKNLELDKNMFIQIEQLRVASDTSVPANDIRLQYSYDRNTGILTIEDTQANIENIYLASSGLSRLNVYIVK